MGREIKRVALDFSWPLNKVWKGFINDLNSKYAKDCPFCDGSGSSPRAKELSDLWYGYTISSHGTIILEFHPESNGSDPFTINHPVIRAKATRNAFFSEYGYGGNIENCWDFYDKNKDKLIPSQYSIETEAKRLCDVCYNNHWSHHLSQDDVDALVQADRLYDFTHQWSNGKGWEVKNPPYHPTAKEVNEWSLTGMGHDSINQWVCVKSRCEKEGVECYCKYCNGDGIIWETEEYKKQAEEWKKVEPPSGNGYQIWETVSEGSPVSPVFENPEDLAKWMIENDKSITKNTTYEQWLKFIRDVKWSPSLIGVNGDIKSGTETIEI